MRRREHELRALGSVRDTCRGRQRLATTLSALISRLRVGGGAAGGGGLGAVGGLGAIGVGGLAVGESEGDDSEEEAYGLFALP